MFVFEPNIPLGLIEKLIKVSDKIVSQIALLYLIFLLYTKVPVIKELGLVVGATPLMISFNIVLAVFGLSTDCIDILTRNKIVTEIVS